MSAHRPLNATHRFNIRVKEGVAHFPIDEVDSFFALARCVAMFDFEHGEVEEWEVERVDHLNRPSPLERFTVFAAMHEGPVDAG